MTDQLETRAVAAQLIHNAIQRIDYTIAADHIRDTYHEDTDVDALALAAEDAAHTATVHLTWGDEPRWTIRRNGQPLHMVDSRAEAETIGRLLVRAETGDHTVRVYWVCPACDSLEDFCPACGDGWPTVLVARGILTAATYSIEPTRPTAD